MSDNLTPSESTSVDTYDGKLHVEWDPSAAVTPMGQLPFFIDFLKLGGLFDQWVDSCPLHYVSNNAPSKINVLGSYLLSILSGHQRYAHMASLQCDQVNSRLLGMSKVVSDDSARRALRKMDEHVGVSWLQHHLHYCLSPLLSTPWILDCDVTIKPLYGHQEGALRGYNPHKPGRPSHTYHTYMIANLRLILDVEVMAGTDTASSYSAPGLWELLDKIPRNHHPQFIRGDCDWGVNDIMTQAEERQIEYLFKVRKSKYVKELIEKHHCESNWQCMTDGWEAIESTLALSTWHKHRRVILVRRQLKNTPKEIADSNQFAQQSFSIIEDVLTTKDFEYSVLVTTLKDEPVSIFSHYRDRADCENNFDEIKNHWGWGGFTTQDLKSCRLIARMVALIYNWWNIFTRLIEPDKHMEAITSRPQLLSSIGQLTQHGRQKTMVITHVHAKGKIIQQAFISLQRFFFELKNSAPQLNSWQCWCEILNKAMSKYLKHTHFKPPDLIYAH